MDSKQRDRKRKARGKAGELYVCEYLGKKGYSIIGTNYSSRYGEIDVIAENESYIVFVEVRTRKQGAAVSGIESISPAKLKKCIRTAAEYLSTHDTNKQPRIDCVQVAVDDNDGEVTDMLYIENAVDDWSSFLI